MDAIEKVTAFILENHPSAGRLLLLFRHPHAGVQIPAGTVEPGEPPDQAALREAREETGLDGLRLRAYLGSQERPFPPEARFVARATTAYARPDRSSFDWIHLPRGVQVRALRQVQGFTQVSYQEWDQVPDRGYATMEVTGWVPDEALARRLVRRFYLLEPAGPGGSEPEWDVEIDHHVFHLFWAPLRELPAIVPPQNGWVEVLFEYLRSTEAGI